MKGLTQSYCDLFIQKNLPSVDEWPEIINVNQELDIDTLNVAAVLLDDAIEEGCGNKVAIHTNTRDWTYGEIFLQANKLANYLSDTCGVVSGNRVLIRSSNSAWAVICWFAVQKVGAVAVTTMAMLRAKELNTILELAEIKLALCERDLFEELESAKRQGTHLQQIIYFTDIEGMGEKLLSCSEKFSNYASRPTDIALIAFTSGTTGQPKGAMHSHRDIVSTCKHYLLQVIRPKSSDIFIGTPPLAFAFGIGALLFFPFHARASSVLLKDNNLSSLTGAIKQFGATILFTAPTAYKAMLENLEEYDLASLEKCVSAGEALPHQTTSAWLDATGIRLLDGIGSTELLHIFISADENTPVGSIGQAVPGYRACVMDENGEKLAAGNIGRLAIKGPTGCRYMNDKRQQTYVVNGWNMTGDSALVDEQGYIWYKSRTDNMIISSGYNIAGSEVEQTLLAHSAVYECGVVGEKDESRGQIVVAFVVLREGFVGNDGLVKELQEFAKSESAPYKYPRKIQFVSSLPRTNTGKVQHYKLVELLKKS